MKHFSQLAYDAATGRIDDFEAELASLKIARRNIRRQERNITERITTLRLYIRHLEDRKRALAN